MVLLVLDPIQDELMLTDKYANTNAPKQRSELMGIVQGFPLEM